MADESTNRGSKDRARISLNEPHEVHYWVMTLGIGEDELRRIIGDVGDSVEAVQARFYREADPSAAFTQRAGGAKL